MVQLVSFSPMKAWVIYRATHYLFETLCTAGQWSCLFGSVCLYVLLWETVDLYGSGSFINSAPTWQYVSNFQMSQEEKEKRLTANKLFLLEMCVCVWAGKRDWEWEKEPGIKKAFVILKTRQSVVTSSYGNVDIHCSGRAVLIPFRWQKWEHNSCRESKKWEHTVWVWSVVG